MDWPADRERPAASVLYDRLNRATAEGLVRREVAGRRDDAYRYRGELPPLKQLGPGL
jgi:hypothetical protein